MAKLLELADYVQRQGELGWKRGQESRLGQLASQAYTTQTADRPQLLGQMAAVSPDAAATQQKMFRQDDSQRMADLSRKARLFVAMAESGNEAAVAGMYPQIAQEARSLNVGDVPLQYDPSFLPGLKQFAAILDDNPQTQQGMAPRVVGDALVDHTGKVLYQSPQQQEYQWSDRAGAWIPKPMAQQQAPAEGLGAGDQPYRLDPNLSPEQREAALADIASNGGATTYQLPPRAQPGLSAIPVAGVGPKGDAQFVTMTPQEIAELGLPPGTVAQRNSENGDINVVNKPDARPGTGGVMPLSAGEAAKVRTQFKETRDALNTFKAFDKALGDIPNGPGLMWDGDARGRLGTSYNNARAALRILYNTGVLQPGELPMLESALRDPNAFSAMMDPRSRPQIQAQLDELYRTTERNIDNLVESYPQLWNKEIYQREKARLSPGSAQPQGGGVDDLLGKYGVQ